MPIKSYANDVIFKGKATVIDGDTLIIQGERIRLFAIDAPEKDQICKIGQQKYACGLQAKQALEDFVKGKTVHCFPMYKNNRWISVCKIGFTDISQHMVLEGWAIAYTRYSNLYYLEQESAKKAKKGIWQGRFMKPYKWRQGHIDKEKWLE